tara:strand:+ start:1 stop:1269 length:1269 start_codon:yes stop_codon:yes gene_type:complete
MWIKRSGLSASQFLYYSQSDGNNKMIIRFNADDTFDVRGKVGGSFPLDIETNRKFTDTSAWYHFVFKFDTTQATEADRFKMYVNGVQETSFSTETYPSQNTNLSMNQTNDQVWVCAEAGTGGYFNGLVTHVHWTDGYAYDASDFGSTDSVTGEWKINTSPSVTYGTNGFFILKDGNSVTDQSGNSNNFTVGGGTLTNTEDCPSDVFATLNPLQQNNTATTYSNGNTKGTGTSSTSNFSSTPATLAASSGKFYAEYKPNLSTTGSSISGFVNLDTADFNATDYYGGSNNMSAGLYDDAGQILHSTGTNLGSVGALSNGDIVMLAMDLDNGYLYWGKNGTWFNSANPATSGGTGGLALSNLGSNGTYTFMNGNRKSMGTEWNFGNGYFGTTAISSEGTNASGIGKFEYDVPTGFTALSTKGLNE